MKNSGDKANNEKAERDSTEDEKCLENGEVEENAKKSRIRQIAKNLMANKYLLVLILLCVLLLIFFIIIIILAVQVGYLSRSTDDQFCVNSECLASAARITSNLNTSYDACRDFWSYSCGGWSQKHSLPENRGSWTVLDEIRSDINWKLRHLIDLVPQNADVIEADGKVKKFYSSCMGFNDIQYYSEPIFKQIIADIGGWSYIGSWSPTAWDRSEAIEKLHLRYGVKPFFQITVGADDRSPSVNIIKIFPHGLGLPGKNYYFDSTSKKYEDSYKLFIDNFARQIGANAADSNRFAENIFHYEKRLAEVMPSPEKLQEPSLLYKKLSIKDLTALTSTIPWLSLLQKKYPKSSLNEVSEVAIYGEEYFRELSTIISSTDTTALHHYLMWQLMNYYAPHLSMDYAKLANQFSQTLAGAQNPLEMAEDRWEFCLRVTSKYFGHALGSMYVKKYFTAETKEEILKIMDNILASFMGHLQGIPWLDDSKSTSVVREKVKVLLRLIGYPDFISNRNLLNEYYSGVNVQVSHLTNLQSAEQFLTTKEDEMLKAPTSPDHSWAINPHDVTALYNYAGNKLVVAAGLLHPSLFDSSTPQAVKYGSIGSILGSFLFKAFDDKGVQYQEYGILSPWLSGRSQKLYRDESECLMKNNTFPPYLESVTNLTIGETVSDIGGLKFAYKAYKEYAANQDKELPGLAINNDRLFFISYSQTMCQNIRQEKIDACQHYSTSSPNQFRVTRTLMQLPEFADAFQCSSSSPMKSVKHCYIW